MPANTACCRAIAANLASAAFHLTHDAASSFFCVFSVVLHRSRGPVCCPANAIYGILDSCMPCLGVGYSATSARPLPGSQCRKMQVSFTLHQSFAVANREHTNPPYEVHEQGWGEFDVQIKVMTLHDSDVPKFRLPGSTVCSRVVVFFHRLCKSCLVNTCIWLSPPAVVVPGFKARK